MHHLEEPKTGYSVPSSDTGLDNHWREEHWERTWFGSAGCGRLGAQDRNPTRAKPYPRYRIPSRAAADYPTAAGSCETLVAA